MTSAANLVTPVAHAASVAEPVSMSARSNFWSRPRALDPLSPEGVAFATLVARAHVRFFFMAHWADEAFASARLRIKAPHSTTFKDDACDFVTAFFEALPDGWRPPLAHPLP